MREFVYLRPGSIAEAISMRCEHEGCSVLLNGGTDVVIQLRDRLIKPDYVIDIKRIEGLREITFSKEAGLFIGACATMNEIGGNEHVKAHYPYAADAVVCITGRDGAREVPIREFITFVRRTVLRPDEIVTGIRVPYVEGLRGIFTKVARRREVDLSTICGTVARVGDEYRLAFGAVAPTPVRLPKTEALLSGKQLTPALIEQAAELARTEVSPIDDVRASKEYRLEVVGVIARRSLEQLA